MFPVFEWNRLFVLEIINLVQTDLIVNRNQCFSSSFFPNLLHHRQYFLIDFPRSMCQRIQSITHLWQICMFQTFQLKPILASHHISRLQIVSSNLMVYKTSRFEQHRQWFHQLVVQIIWFRYYSIHLFYKFLLKHHDPYFLMGLILALNVAEIYYLLSI